MGDTLLGSDVPLPRDFDEDKPKSEVGGVGDERDLGVLMGCSRRPGEFNVESAMSSSESTTAMHLFGFLASVISGDAGGDAWDWDWACGWEESVRVGRDPSNKSSVPDSAG